MKTRALLAPLAATLLSALVAAQRDTVSVFVLAGQSNMEGKAQNKLWEHQATDPKTAEHFEKFREDGGWIERDDVFIKFFGRHGKLTLGYGSRDRTGCELAFGHYVGDAIDGPVLLIKTAWGGRSLRKDFRPPSAGMPPIEVLEEEMRNREKRAAKRGHPAPTAEELRGEYGRDYRLMMQEIRSTLENCDELFPELRRRKKKLAGFVWFQGWNDQYGGAELEYEDNLRHLIRDVRRDLGVPDLPFVIGVMGQNGSKPAKGAMKVIQDAQLAVARTDEFENVRSVRTDVLVDEAAEKLYPEWKDRFEEWEKTGSDHPYHYLGSAIWFTRIGEAFGREMIEMMR